jgi:hypothetical protein
MRLQRAVRTTTYRPFKRGWRLGIDVSWHRLSPRQSGILRPTAGMHCAACRLRVLDLKTSTSSQLDTKKGSDSVINPNHSAGAVARAVHMTRQIWEIADATVYMVQDCQPSLVNTL